MDSKHFKTYMRCPVSDMAIVDEDFFVCPRCRAPLYTPKRLIHAVRVDNVQACTKCGEKIANALAEALAEVKAEMLRVEGERG